MATQGGGDEKLMTKGPESSQATGGIVESALNDEYQQKLPFITLEPLREDQVQNAVKFLSHPKVRGSPVIYRRSFLERKGLTKEEIDEAFRLVPDPPANATTAETLATSQATQPRTSTSLYPQAPIQLPPSATAQAGVVSLAPMSQQPRFRWSHALLAIGVLSASGAGSALFFKKVVLPRFKAWIRRVAVEDTLSVKEDTLSVKEDTANKSLAEETVEAAKAAASAAAIVATASQELLNSKNEDRKYFEAFMGMIDVQVKEMKSMTEAIHKLEKVREQDKLIDEYFQYATANGSSNSPWGTPQVNQTAATPNYLQQAKVNDTLNTSYGSAGQSVATPVEPTTAFHPKSYMEIMAMVQRGEKPPNIKEINDAPPNPNQPPSKPLVAPKTKPWEIPQQNPITLLPQEYDQLSEPWWRKKSVKITELEPNGAPANEMPQAQRVWVPPQPPSVAIPEAAAAIRHPKSSPAVQEKHSSDESAAMEIPREGDGAVTVGTLSSGRDSDSSSAAAPSAAVHRPSEIEEERDYGVEVVL